MLKASYNISISNNVTEKNVFIEHNNNRNTTRYVCNTRDCGNPIDTEKFMLHTYYSCIIYETTIFFNFSRM